MDSNDLTYDWSGSFGNATGISPTINLPLGISNVSLVVNDGLEDSVPDQTNITVKVGVSGLLAPLNSGLKTLDQSLDSIDKMFKHGRTLPLKLGLSCTSRNLTAGDLSPENYPQIVSINHVGTSEGSVPLVDIDAGESNNDGLYFRYDYDSGNWIYNLKTTNLNSNTEYAIVIRMPDGLNYHAKFALK